MKKIGFFEELQPNGMVAFSNTRLMCFLALIAALALIFVIAMWQNGTDNTLLILLKEGTVKPADITLIAPAIGPGEVMVGGFFTLLTYAFGFKAYAKNKELSKLDKDTPSDTAA